eukprot:9480282-Pyramimonas_sp.AAC.1
MLAVTWCGLGPGGLLTRCARCAIIPPIPMRPLEPSPIHTQQTAEAGTHSHNALNVAGVITG